MRLGELSLRVTTPLRNTTSSSGLQAASPTSSQGSFVLVPSEEPLSEAVDCPPLLRRSPPRATPAGQSLASHTPTPRAPRVEIGSPRVPVCTLESSLAPQQPPSSSPCSASYPLQGFGPGPAAASSSPNQTDISTSFPPVPPSVLSLGRGISDPSGYRVQRAWTAGLWAGAVLQGRARVVNRMPPLDLRNRLYIVLRAPDLEGPGLYNNFSTYRRVVRNHSTDSVSHGFPSLAEVRVYCAGAGVVCPEEQ